MTELTDGRQEIFSVLVQEVALACADQVKADWQYFTKSRERTLDRG